MKGRFETYVMSVFYGGKTGLFLKQGNFLEIVRAQDASKPVQARDTDNLSTRNELSEK